MQESPLLSTFPQGMGKNKEGCCKGTLTLPKEVLQFMYLNINHTSLQ